VQSTYGIELKEPEAMTGNSGAQAPDPESGSPPHGGSTLHEIGVGLVARLDYANRVCPEVRLKVIELADEECGFAS